MKSNKGETDQSQKSHKRVEYKQEIGRFLPSINSRTETIFKKFQSQEIKKLNKLEEKPANFRMNKARQTMSCKVLSIDHSISASYQQTRTNVNIQEKKRKKDIALQEDGELDYTKSDWKKKQAEEEIKYFKNSSQCTESIQTLTKQLKTIETQIINSSIQLQNQKKLLQSQKEKLNSLDKSIRNQKLKLRLLEGQRKKLVNQSVQNNQSDIESLKQILQTSIKTLNVQLQKFKNAQKNVQIFQKRQISFRLSRTSFLNLKSQIQNQRAKFVIMERPRIKRTSQKNSTTSGSKKLLKEINQDEK